MLTAFIGYVLPWGQMSFWGATVIINFLTVIPYIGYLLALLLWGGYSVGSATLNRFFIIHLVIPFIISVSVVLHVYYLHEVGSSNAITCSIVKESIILGYYFKLKDLLILHSISISLSELTVFSFNLGHSANYVLASPLVTPYLILPEWYFLSFYAILRGIPNKFFGIISFISLIYSSKLKALLNTEYD